MGGLTQLSSCNSLYSATFVQNGLPITATFTASATSNLTVKEAAKTANSVILINVQKLLDENANLTFGGSISLTQKTNQKRNLRLGFTTESEVTAATATYTDEQRNAEGITVATRLRHFQPDHPIADPAGYGINNNTVIDEIIPDLKKVGAAFTAIDMFESPLHGLLGVGDDLNINFPASQVTITNFTAQHNGSNTLNTITGDKIVSLSAGSNIEPFNVSKVNNWKDLVDDRVFETVSYLKPDDPVTAQIPVADATIRVKAQTTEGLKQVTSITSDYRMRFDTDYLLE